VGKAFQFTAKSLFSVLFPSDCRICQSPLLGISNLPVCDDCLEGMVPIEGVLCSVCGEKLFGQPFVTEAGPLCGLCRRAAPRFRKAVAYGTYDGPLRDLIHILKYQRVRSAAPLLGKLVREAVQEAGLSGPLAVIPVPLWPEKRRARGFNQAEEIARSFCRAQASAGIQLEATLLIRTRETTSQTGLTRLQRRANLRGAFAVRHTEKLRGRRVLLADDVLTTGSTAGECARVLLRGGAKEVFVATVARATREAESVFKSAARGGTLGHA
jgi:ComF family protein